MGLFDLIFNELSSQDIPDQLQIDATHLKAHRLQPFKKGGVPRDIGRTRGGLNSKLHAVCDDSVKPVLLYLTAGQVSDYKSARELLDSFPASKYLLADRGYDADWFRDGLLEKEIIPCIPPRKSRKRKISYD